MSRLLKIIIYEHIALLNINMENRQQTFKKKPSGVEITFFKILSSVEARRGWGNAKIFFKGIQVALDFKKYNSRHNGFFFNNVLQNSLVKNGTKRFEGVGVGLENYLKIV